MAPKVMKGKRTATSVPIVRKGTFRSALLSNLKAKSGRKDIKFRVATSVASAKVEEHPLELRAGFPLKLRKGAVHPKDWVTAKGVPIIVDTSRSAWLPDDWGQGVKQTKPTSHSTGTGGGILTTFVAPDGKTSFFHKETSEEFAGLGRKLTLADGWNGQVRRAKLESQQALQLARAEGENAGVENDASLLKLLSAPERRHLPSKEELHVAIISARRATELHGVRDIFTVQCQFEEAGVCPTWYVDAGSLKAYQALGLKAVVGGKLTPARQKALSDAKRRGKVCVQVSDDISMWEYRDGASAKERTDDAVNAAHAKARRLIISPVAAARFIAAKMRGAEGAKPKLGGTYMLGSCARAFFGEAFQRQHFILGDFFVVEPDSTVKFDDEMKLKEDYDFTCAHIAKYGSVMRCSRMTLNVKHYSNSGGACTMRDKKGQEEQRNIAILNRKWPRCFRPNPKRKNEVILKWRGSVGDDGEDGGEVPGAGATRTKPTSAKVASGGVAGKAVKKLHLKKRAAAAPPAAVARRSAKVLEAWKKKWPANRQKDLKQPPGWPAEAYPDPSAAVSWLPEGWSAGVSVTSGSKLLRCYISREGKRYFHKPDVEAAVGRTLKCRALKQRPLRPEQDQKFGGGGSKIAIGEAHASCKTPYIRKRCLLAAGRKVADVVSSMRFKDSTGKVRTYRGQDLTYDINCKFLSLGA